MIAKNKEPDTSKQIEMRAGEYNLFGYCTNNCIPGLEIIGIGKYSRGMKERITYLTRKFGVDLPLKRYVLCVEYIPNPEDVEKLALPLLLMVWAFAGHIDKGLIAGKNIKGQVSIDGVVTDYIDEQLSLDAVLTVLQHRQLYHKN